MMKKHERKVAVMTTKIVFTLLALAVTVLPAAAQNQFLTSFSDSLGPHVFYQIPAEGTNGNDGFHIWQIAPSFGWAGDMNQLPATCASVSPAETCLPLPINLSPLVSYFSNTENVDRLIYINWFGNVENVGIDSSGTIGAEDTVAIFSGGPRPDGRSLTGFSNDSGPNVYTTGIDGSVYHMYLSPTFPVWYPLYFYASLPGSGACGPVNSALAALSDSRVSPNLELVFYVGGSGHLCMFGEDPPMSDFASLDLTALCQGAAAPTQIPCGDGAPQPMLKSPLTGFTDSGGVHVFYLDTLGHLNEFVAASDLIDPDGQNVFSNFNLWNRVVCPPLVLPGGHIIHLLCPATAADSLTSFTNAFGPQVFYVDVNGHVNQINLKSGTHQDLTRLFGRDPAAVSKQLGNGTCTVGTSLSSIGVDNNGIEWVYYIDDVGHVVEFDSVDGSTWAASDLTLAFGTPIAIVQRSC